MNGLRVEANTQGALAAPISEPVSTPERLLGRLGDPTRGATLICVAGLHGNEPSGVAALIRILERLSGEASDLGGCLVGLTGNRRALALDRRYLDRDLNRIWRAGEVSRVREAHTFEAAEDAEMAELDGVLQQVLDEAGEDT